MSSTQAALPAADRAPKYSILSEISFSAIGIVAAALLVFVSGSFVIASVLGVKRELEGVLIAPLAMAAAYYWINHPRRSINPLVGFVLVKTIVELALRHELVWVLDSVASLCALTVILSAAPRIVELGAKTVVTAAGVFALMSLLQWCLLFSFPELQGYGIALTDDNDPINGIPHPVAMLGLFTFESYNLFGHAIGRVHSFTQEPSLNVLYFLFPACIGLLLKSKLSWFFSAAIVVFCVVSLSGSIFMSLGFSAIWWLLIRFVGIRIAFTYGMPLFMVAYLYTIRAAGLEPLLNALNYAAQYGDFLSKQESLTNRALNSGVNLDTAMATPLGSTTHPDLPGPFLINSTLEAGWLGCLMLLLFLGKFATQLQIMNSDLRAFDPRRIGTFLLLGAMSTIVVFNDYSMSNYAGIAILGFLYRMICINNERTRHAQALSRPNGGAEISKLI